MKSKYASKCPKCDRDWAVGDEIFMSKSSDGNTWIKCSDKECFESQGGKILEGKKQFVSQKFPIQEAVNLYKLSEEFLETFMKKRDEPLPIKEQVVFIESVFRTLSGNFKP